MQLEEAWIQASRVKQIFSSLQKGRKRWKKKKKNCHCELAFSFKYVGWRGPGGEQISTVFWFFFGKLMDGILDWLTGDMEEELRGRNVELEFQISEGRFRERSLFRPDDGRWWRWRGPALYPRRSVPGGRCEIREVVDEVFWSFEVLRKIKMLKGMISLCLGTDLEMEVQVCNFSSCGSIDYNCIGTWY